MTELIFIVQEAPEGGYTARALGEPIFAKRMTLLDFMNSSATPSAAILKKASSLRPSGYTLCTMRVIAV